MRVEEIFDAARVQPKLATKFTGGKPAVAKLGENANFDASEKNLGIPKTKSRLQNRRGIEECVHVAEHDLNTRNEQF